MSFLQFKLFESPKRAAPSSSDRWFYCLIGCFIVAVLNWTTIDILANSSATRFLEWLETWNFVMPLLLIFAVVGGYATILRYLPRRFSYVIFPVLFAVPASAHLATMLVSVIKGVSYFNDLTGWIMLLMGVFLPFCLFITIYVSRELWIANRKCEGGKGQKEW